MDDEVTCRKPQRLPGSRLLGPAVCLSDGAWAEHVEPGKDISPDGRNYVLAATDFEKKNSTNPPTCVPQSTGSATTAMAGLTRVVCF